MCQYFFGTRATFFYKKCKTCLISSGFHATKCKIVVDILARVPYLHYKKGKEMLKKNKPKRITVRVVVEQDTFDEAQEILKTVNFTIGEVIGMLCNQIVIQRKIPFEIKAKEDGEEKK